MRWWRTPICSPRRRWKASWRRAPMPPSIKGDFRKIVQGVNDTLDAVIGPLNVAAKYFDQISKGDIPAKITDNYNGDFNTIKNNLNACIDGLGGLQEANHRSEKDGPQRLQQTG